jgi:hypothetical protein
MKFWLAKTILQSSKLRKIILLGIDFFETFGIGYLLAFSFVSSSMKSLLSIIFLLLYGFAYLRPILPLVEYAMDYQTYLERCENRDRPSLKCNGTCILAKKIAASQATSPAEEPVLPAFEAEEWVSAHVPASPSTLLLNMSPAQDFLYPPSFPLEVVLSPPCPPPRTVS